MYICTSDVKENVLKPPIFSGQLFIECLFSILINKGLSGRVYVCLHIAQRFGTNKVPSKIIDIASSADLAFNSQWLTKSESQPIKEYIWGAEARLHSFFSSAAASSSSSRICLLKISTLSNKHFHSLPNSLQFPSTNCCPFPRLYYVLRTHRKDTGNVAPLHTIS